MQAYINKSKVNMIILQLKNNAIKNYLEHIKDEQQGKIAEQSEVIAEKSKVIADLSRKIEVNQAEIAENLRELETLRESGDNNKILQKRIKELEEKIEDLRGHIAGDAVIINQLRGIKGEEVPPADNP